MNRALGTSLAGLLACVFFGFAATGSSNSTARYPQERADVAAFRAAEGGQVSAVTVELRTPKVKATDRPAANAVDAHERQRRTRIAQQDAFIASLPARGINLLPTRVDAPQGDGVVREIQHRYTQVLNGFSAHVANRDIERLRALPEVLSVSIDGPVQLHLNNAINYAMGTHPIPADRRLAVFGPTEELTPAGSADHPETPRTTTVDGVEGQNIVLAVIDTGVDWKHPMFGGTGQTTPNPQFPPAAPAPGDNKKVTYLINFTPGAPGDDFGHGTFVGTNAAGYRVDGLTPPNPGYGTGPNGAGIGPTPGGAVLHGTGPQATIMAYKTLSAAGAGVNNSTQLALDDAGSPCVTAVSTASCIAKPIADVINMSLGSAGGSAVSAGAKSSNNAALAGAIVVASAGNAGPRTGPTHYPLGSPCTGTLVICIASSLDPGSIAGGAVLLEGQITGEPTTAGTGGPPAEYGAASDANLPNTSERQALRLFIAAGGGPLQGSSVSAQYVFADMAGGSVAPVTLTNRIALVQGTGAFAGIANYAAPLQPVAILIISDVQSATAVTVIGGVPTFTISVADANYLKALNPGGMAHGAVSKFPLRIKDSIALAAYLPAMSGFSSRGPNAVAGSDYRTIKPDVTAPGSGILAGGTPDGNPNGGLGMADPNGYLIASGTSFSGPITAGAMTLIRQHVRDNLGFDTINRNDPSYRAKRFEAATIARALLQNNTTNLRNGQGAAEAYAGDSATIHDMGAGHIDIAASLSAKAIMVAPTKLLGNGVEFDLPAMNPPALDASGNLEVWLPTRSFGRVGVANAPATVSKLSKVQIRDITAGGGAGTYALSVHDDINLELPGVSVDFLATDRETPITSIAVPSGGIGEFYTRISIDGTVFTTVGTDIAWHVAAQQTGSGRILHMPFYLHSLEYVPVIEAAAPVQDVPTNVESPAAPPACGTDTNSAYTLNFSYTPPDGAPNPIGFRVQEGSGASSALFNDPADEQLVTGSNSRWSGSPQWTTAVNPGSGSPAYYVPDTAMQNESLTMINAVSLPASATLSFDTFQDTEEGFDYVLVELVIGNSTVELGSFSGSFSGKRSFDLSPWGGQSVKVRLRMTSDANTGFSGWFVENIRIDADDFVTIGETAGNASTFAVTGRASGTRYYRIAGLFDFGGTVAGPFSNLQCVTVDIPNVKPVAVASAPAAVDEGTTGVALNGTGSSDPEGGALTFAWTSRDGVSITNANAASASFTAPTVASDTDYTFDLEVTDVGGLKDAATVVVTVRNVALPPVANAGPDLTVDERRRVVLDGAGSATNPPGRTLTYQWTQFPSATVELTGATTASPSFTAPSVEVNETLLFDLTVRDPDGLEHTDRVAITVRDLQVEGITRILGGPMAPASLIVLGLLWGLRRRR